MINIREKLKEFNGSYFFDLSNAEDAEYVLHMLGGEELLQSKFPLIHNAYLKSVENANMEKNSKDISNRLDVHFNHMEYKANGKGTNFSGVLSGFLCDTTIPLNQVGLEAPKPWSIGYVIVNIVDHDDSSIPPYASITTIFKNKNRISNKISTTTEISPGIVAKSNISAISVVSGIDPGGQLVAAAFSDTFANHEDTGVRVVDRIVIEDPRSYQDKPNNPIIMLYGREANQNPDFKKADYLNGEYKDNNGDAAGDSDLKTLMPLKGSIVFKEGLEFIGLQCPDTSKGVNMYRPTIGLNDTILVKYYENEWGKKSDVDYNMEMYTKIKDCFKVDDKKKNICNFDLKIGNSVDWWANVKGASKYTKDNNRILDYIVRASFKLVVSDGNLPMPVDLIIQSIDDKSKDLYITTDGTSVVNIPPIRVHWGCIAGSSDISTDNGLKKISDLTSGDSILTTEGTYVTVAQVFKAVEDKIYNIKTTKGSIGLTGGHPVLLHSGEEKKAVSLEKGESLTMHNGEAAEILEVSLDDYNDLVYNVLIQETDEGSYIYANGFAVGDIGAQNRPLNAETIVYSEEEIALQEEFEHLHAYLNNDE